MQDLINDAFKFLNAYKRHRTLHTEAKHKNNYSDALTQELRMFQTIDSLELVIRGIQRLDREKTGEVTNSYKSSTDTSKTNYGVSYNKNSIPISNNSTPTKGEITSTKVGV